MIIITLVDIKRVDETSLYVLHFARPL